MAYLLVGDFEVSVQGIDDSLPFNEANGSVSEGFFFIYCWNFRPWDMGDGL